MSVHRIARAFQSKTTVLLAIGLCILVFASTSYAATVNCSGVAAWSANSVSYTAGTLVTYQGSEYKCLQSHTSQAGWDPVDVPALWSLAGACGTTSTPTPSPTATTKPTATPTATTNPTSTPKPTATATATAKPTATSTPTGTTCWAAWSSSAQYNGGAQVSYNGENYQAAYWTQGNNPSTSSGPAGSGQPWIPESTCGGGPQPTPTATATVAPTATAKPTATATTQPTATATPKGTPNGSLPKHLIEGYWQDFVNSAPALSLASVPTSYNLVAVAFANATTTPGAVSFSIDSGLTSALGGYSDSQFIADINTLHGRGQRVIVSVGGQNGTISVSDSTSASNFANSVVSIMNQYGFDGVDIDLENGVNPTYMANSLHQLASAKPGVIITMAPQTIDVLNSSSDYLALALNIQDVLTIMNTQYYNSGSMNGCNGNVYSEATEDFITAMACTQLQTSLRPDQIGVGLPATSSAAGSGYVSPSVVVSALDCLAKGTSCGSFVPSAIYPTIRGAMTWSINWDDQSGYAFANTVSSGLSSLP